MAQRYAKDQPSNLTNQIKNVAIVGAAGHVGTYITSSLLKTNNHTITAITRPSSTSVFPPAVKVIKVDYTNPDHHTSLVSALTGQDALVITMHNMAPTDTVSNIVLAAIEANVPWILPNEWGADYTDPDLNRDTKVGGAQVEIRDLIREKGGSSGTGYIAVVCGFWYERALAGGEYTLGFDFKNKRATFFDDGDLTLHYTTLGYCGTAVAALLSLPILPRDTDDMSPCLENYRNQLFRVRCFSLSQRDMLASVLRVTGDQESEWTVERVRSVDRYDEGKRLLEEEGNMMGWRLMLFSRMMFPGVRVDGVEKYEDGRLRLEAVGDVDEATRWAVEHAE